MIALDIYRSFWLACHILHIQLKHRCVCLTKVMLYAWWFGKYWSLWNIRIAICLYKPADKSSAKYFTGFSFTSLGYHMLHIADTMLKWGVKLYSINHSLNQSINQASGCRLWTTFSTYVEISGRHSASSRIVMPGQRMSPVWKIL